MNFERTCKYGHIKYLLPCIPEEIARCFCSVCQKIHHRTPVKFAQYSVKDIMFVVDNNQIELDSVLDNFKIIKSSNRALRFACNKCDDILLMHYNDSPKIWFVTDTFKFDTKIIEHYDIHK
jgi:hypothetical protein